MTFVGREGQSYVHASRKEQCVKSRNVDRKIPMLNRVNSFVKPVEQVSSGKPYQNRTCSAVSPSGYDPQGHWSFGTPPPLLGYWYVRHTLHRSLVSS